MSYLGRVPHVRRPASGGADHGILYAFDDQLIIVWIKPSFLGKVGLRREPMPQPLRELDAVPPSEVSTDDVLAACKRKPSVYSTEGVARAVLERSKAWGALIGVSRVELTFREGESAVFYADRDATAPVVEILKATLGERFESQRG
jgi:hypothetical protein